AEVQDEHDEDGGLRPASRQPDRGVLLDQGHDDAGDEDPYRGAGRAGEEGHDEGVDHRVETHPRINGVLQAVPDGGHAGEHGADEEDDQVDGAGVDADDAGQIRVDPSGLDLTTEGGPPQDGGEGHDEDDGAGRLP